MARRLLIANGQLGASSASITTGPSDDGQRVTIVLTNTSEKEQDIYLFISVNGGTNRQLPKATLKEDETAILDGIPLTSADTLKGYSTNAEAVDYLVWIAPDDQPFSVYGVSEVGATK